MELGTERPGGKPANPAERGGGTPCSFGRCPPGSSVQYFDTLLFIDYRLCWCRDFEEVENPSKLQQLLDHDSPMAAKAGSHHMAIRHEFTV